MPKADNRQSKIDFLTIENDMLKKKLADLNAIFLNIVGKNPSAMLVLDQHKKIIYANPSALRLFKKNLVDLLGDNFDIADTISDKLELSVLQDHGIVKMVEASSIKIEWKNAPCTLVSLHDITEQKSRESNLKHESTHDALTGLWNRLTYEKKIREAILCANENQTFFGIIYVDLNKFKEINDVLGHAAGDALLKEFSKTLLSAVRLHDKVFRLGGDEFSIIIEGFTNSEAIDDIFKKITSNLARKYSLEGKKTYITASTGLAVYPRDAKTIGELIKFADAAMYQEKYQKNSKKIS